MLWLYDDTRAGSGPELLYMADAATTVLALGVRAGLVTIPAPASAEVACFNAARLARLGAGGPDV